MAALRPGGVQTKAVKPALQSSFFTFFLKFKQVKTSLLFRLKILQRESQEDLCKVAFWLQDAAFMFKHWMNENNIKNVILLEEREQKVSEGSRRRSVSAICSSS